MHQSRIIPIITTTIAIMWQRLKPQLLLQTSQW